MIRGKFIKRIRKPDLLIECMKILIDNGHGDFDYTNGKYSPKVTDIDDATVYKERFREGIFNRLVANKIVSKLRTLGYDAELLVPEPQDISLAERVRRINKHCAKLGAGNVIMVSIHSNALGYGDEWYPNANYWTVWTTVGKTNSDKLATYLWESCKSVMPDKKFGKDTKDGDVDYESNFYIIKKANCPAVLTENFFYTCKENLKFIASPEGRDLIAEGHVKGIINYLNGN